MTTRTTPNTHALVFKIDAALAAVMGAALLALASPLRALAGGGLSVDALRLVGLFLLPWAAHNWLTGRDASPRLTRASVQLVGDALWIALSLALCVDHWAMLTSVGRFLYASQTAVVALVFATKLRVTLASVAERRRSLAAGAV